MKDYQKRVLEEQRELADKIVSLTLFITDFDKTEPLGEAEFNLMRKQLNVMLEYEMVLQMRILLFTDISDECCAVSEDWVHKRYS